MNIKKVHTKISLGVLFVLFTMTTQAQTYFHPTVGIQSEFVGSCLVSTCSGTYLDNGGGGGNYSNNINQIYRVFCPNTAGQCMQVTFNSFNVEAGYDFLLVKNGPTQNSPTFTTFPASPTVYAGITGLNGNLNGVTPFSYTSTDASGCLTFRFYADNIFNRAGWNATLQCVPCAGGPNGTDNNDCINLTPLCSGTTINGASTGPGIVAEGCTGSTCPAGGENFSSWYTITAQTTGTFNITLTPNVGTGDYDFAIYGPNVTCGALGAPLRCTDAALTGVTGLTGTAGDFTENVNGDKFLQTMNIVAGETYIIVVDEWSPNSAGGYALAFGGTASLDCTILPIELSEFTTEYNSSRDVVDVFWITDTEKDNDYFDVERSTDNVNFEAINRVKGAGNSTYETQYYVEDNNPFPGMNYYRLKQVDFDGEFKYSDIRTVNILSDEYDLITVFPNPTTDEAEIIFNSYDDNGAILQITSSQGRVIVNTPIETTAGSNRVNVNLSEHDKGVYLIRVVTKEKAFTTRLIKR